MSPAVMSTEETCVAWRSWLLGWFGMLALALLNGTLRAMVTQPLLGETTARALATVILLAAVTGYAWWLHRRRPIPTGRQAWAIGLAWVAMTLTFEFGRGGLVEGLSWATMLADYDVTAGRIWVLVPIWTLLVPEAVRRTSSRTARSMRVYRRCRGSRRSRTMSPHQTGRTTR
jgi:hypothetical protein